MRDLPRLGPELPEWAVYVCGYSASPADVICGRDATWHGFVLGDPRWGIAMMESCDGHLPQMKATADYVHPLVHPCGIPGSQFRWPENECFMDWDEAAELAAAGVLAGAGPLS
jgi:hypothetical protein